MVDIKVENCVTITEAVAEVKDWDMEEGTVAMDVVGLAVTSDTKVPSSTQGTTEVHSYIH